MNKPLIIVLAIFLFGFLGSCKKEKIINSLCGTYVGTVQHHSWNHSSPGGPEDTTYIVEDISAVFTKDDNSTIHVVVNLPGQIFKTDVEYMPDLSTDEYYEFAKIDIYPTGTKDHIIKLYKGDEDKVSVSWGYQSNHIMAGYTNYFEGKRL